MRKRLGAFTALWMLLATSAFTLMAFIIKLQSARMPVADLLFVRCASSALLVLACQPLLGFALRSRAIGLHVRRGVCGLVAMAIWYHTLGVLPMAVSVTLNYMSPLFLGLVLLATDRGAQQPSAAELACLALGFVGVVVLLNPMGTGAGPRGAIALGVLGAAMAALAFKDVRALKTAGENEWQMVFFFSLVAALGALPFTALVRLDTSAGLTSHAWVVLAGLLGALGQWGVSKAFGSGDAVVAASMQYLSVVMSLGLSWLALGEAVSAQALAGVAMIVAAAVLTVWQRGR